MTQWPGYVNSKGRDILRGLEHIWKSRILVRIYLFSGSVNDMASYGIMISEELIGKDVEKSCRGLLWGIILYLPEGTEEIIDKPQSQ
jgi:hypothetical protein